MKKLLILLAFVTTSAFSQNTIVIRHTNYTSIFDTVRHYPVEVHYWLTKANEQCKHLPRKNEFKPDPLFPQITNLEKYYSGSPYDRGHNDAAEDNECQGAKVEQESFYFSNMTPQWPGLNRGSWKELEGIARGLAVKYDSVEIWCGSVGVAAKIGIVSVPVQMWKIIYIPATGKTEAFLFQNLKNDNPNKPNGKSVTVKEIENITHLHLK